MWEENKSLILTVDQDGEFKLLDIEDYFNLLKRLIGNKKLKSEIRENLQEIILLEKDEVRINITEQSKNVFYKLFEHDLLLSYDFKLELLPPRDKSYNIFELLWTFYYYSGLELNSRIRCTSKISESFFDIRSDFSYGYLIKNLDFIEDAFTAYYITECVIEDCTFDFTFGDLIRLRRNHISNCTFTNIYMETNVENNNFENVTFKNIQLGEGLVFKDNKLTNCKFENVRILDETWLDKINRNNELDDFFLKNHKIVYKSDDNSDIKYHYIVVK